MVVQRAIRVAAEVMRRLRPAWCAEREWSVAADLLWLTMAGALLVADYNQFTWKAFGLHDYGIYTNMLWNTAHGHPFRYLMDGSYLTVHLSFSLALLSPLFYVWDHPFLLALVQWSAPVLGSLIVRFTALRLGLRRDLTSALSLLLLAYPFTQAVLLCEFHGVSLFFLLVPWLHYCALFNRRWVWLPLVLLAGLREDGFVVAAPLLFYMAHNERWRAGWAWGSLTLAYGLLALVFIYPSINGFSLMDKRSAVMAPDVVASALSVDRLWPRVVALFKYLLPAVVLLVRAPLAVLSPPSLILLQSMASGLKRQHRLTFHYSAAPMACLVSGMLEAIRQSLRPGARGTLNTVLTARYILLVTVGMHFCCGYVLGGAKQKEQYKHASQGIHAVMKAVRNLPKDGVLQCPGSLTGFCANRADLMSSPEGQNDIGDTSLAFFHLKDAREGSGYRRMLKGQKFGVIYFDQGYVILKRGSDPASNPVVLAAADALP